MATTKTALFKSLKGWEATKASLHAYSKVVGAIPRAHAEPHPKWWHISLHVFPDGIRTGAIPLSDGGSLQLVMDLRRHVLAIETGGRQAATINLEAGFTANELAERLFSLLIPYGLKGPYAQEKYEDDQPRTYNPIHADTFLTTLVEIDRIFKAHRLQIGGETGPVQFWPHGFDLAFEWFGTRQVVYEEDGDVTRYPSQLNLGWSPGEPNHPEPYFYSNPWPFEREKLLGNRLPSGAEWFTGGWEGSLLEYSALVGEPEAEQKLLAYARTVYELAAPTLTAE